MASTDCRRLRRCECYAGCLGEPLVPGIHRVRRHQPLPERLHELVSDDANITAAGRAECMKLKSRTCGYGLTCVREPFGSKDKACILGPEDLSLGLRLPPVRRIVSKRDAPALHVSP